MLDYFKIIFVLGIGAWMTLWALPQMDTPMSVCIPAFIIVTGLFISCFYLPSSYIGKKLKVPSIIFFGSLLVLGNIWLTCPIGFKLSPMEEEFMTHLNAGYSLFQNSNYPEAIREYEKAEKIYDKDSELYLFKCYAYQYMKDYKKAIETAKIGLMMNEKDSIYKKAHHFRAMNLRNDIGFYTTIGKCSYRLEDYAQGEEAYTYVINNVKYKYTDAYFWRGVCRYNQGKKSLARYDFIKHKEIILKYFEDQANSEYKHTYPTYTDKDIERVNNWINSCD